MPRMVQGAKPKVENPGRLFMRLMRYVLKNYAFQCLVVLICIFISVLANVQGTLFMQTLIDDYILPLTKQATPDFSELAAAISRVGSLLSLRYNCLLCQCPPDGKCHPGNHAQPA